MDRVIMDWPTEFIVTEIAGVPPSCLRQASRALESRFPKMVQKSMSGIGRAAGRHTLAVTLTECSLAVWR